MKEQPKPNLPCIWSHLLGRSFSFYRSPGVPRSISKADLKTCQAWLPRTDIQFHESALACWLFSSSTPTHLLPFSFAIGNECQRRKLQCCGLETQTHEPALLLKCDFIGRRPREMEAFSVKGFWENMSGCREAGKFAGPRFAAFCSAVTVEIQLSKVDAIQ